MWWTEGAAIWLAQRASLWLSLCVCAVVGEMKIVKTKLQLTKWPNGYSQYKENAMKTEKNENCHHQLHRACVCVWERAGQRERKRESQRAYRVILEVGRDSTRGLGPFAFLVAATAYPMLPRPLSISLWNTPTRLSLLSQVKESQNNNLRCSDAHSTSMRPFSFPLSLLNAFQTFISMFISVWPRRKHLSWL